MSGETNAADRFDAIVIGSGQGANPLAKALANAGKRTALIESTHIGGTCINEGCTPTKTMVASARVAYLARRGADYGVQTGPVAVDMQKVRDRKRAIVEDFRSGGERGVTSTQGLEWIQGEGHFSGKGRVTVALNAGGEREISGDLIIVNVGCRPSIPSTPGLSEVPYLTSTTVMELDTVPEHLIVLGGGYVGVEFGQMFRRFGSRVTLLQHSGKLLAREDDDVSDEVVKILREDGIDIMFNSETVRVAKHADGIAMTLRDANGERELVGSHLLVATGRTPNTERLTPGAAGIETDKHGYITVNERLETNVPGVYAIGDVKGGPAFTHISYDDFRILRANLLEGGHATTTGRLVPNVVFMDPQLGVVGMRESEARASGRPIKVAKIPMTWVARALETDETRGFMKAVVDTETKQILGFAMLGIEGGEIMSAMELAMMGRLTYPVVREAIFAHPTLSESLNNLFLSMEE